MTARYRSAVVAALAALALVGLLYLELALWDISSGLFSVGQSWLFIVEPGGGFECILAGRGSLLAAAKSQGAVEGDLRNGAKVRAGDFLKNDDIRYAAPRGEVIEHWTIGEVLTRNWRVHDIISALCGSQL